MRTKEEILLPLHSHCPEELEMVIPWDSALKAMDEYAREHVFAFLKFRDEYQKKERAEWIEYCAKNYNGMLTAFVGAADEKIYEEFLRVTP